MNLAPGFDVREVDPAVDLDAVSDLHAAVDVADIGERDHQRDWIVETWRSPAFVGGWVVTDAAGDVAGYVELEASDPSSTIEGYAPVRPDLRDGPLYGSLLAFVEARARAAAGDASPRLLVVCAETDLAFASVATRAGFAKARTFWHMERSVDRSLEPGEPPAGVAIRPSVAGADEHAVFLVLDAAFRGHFGIEPLPEDAWREEFFEMPLYDPSLVLIAEVEGEPVGVAASFVPDGIGWVGDVGVLEAYRGRGIGTALLRASFAALAARGVTNVRLNVDADNETGAPRLYASVGMRVRRAFDVYEKRLVGG